MWNTLSWRGAAAAAVSEEPVNYFSQVTSCYPKVQGQFGGGGEGMSVPSPQLAGAHAAAACLC